MADSKQVQELRERKEKGETLTPEEQQVLTDADAQAVAEEGK